MMMKWSRNDLFPNYCINSRAGVLSEIRSTRRARGTLLCMVDLRRSATEIGPSAAAGASPDTRTIPARMPVPQSSVKIHRNGELQQNIARSRATAGRGIFQSLRSSSSVIQCVSFSNSSLSSPSRPSNPAAFNSFTASTACS
jgi:hypothetical protein